MNMKRIFFSIILLSIILLSFSGCVEKTHQATESSAPETTPNNSSSINVDGIEIYENISELINETFSYNNRTYGAFYDDVELEDTSYPKERVFVIRSQSDFDKIFAREIDNTPVDYQSETYVLYTFTTVYPYEFVVESASVNEHELNIQFRLKSPNDPDENGYVPPEPLIGSTRPFQRFILIKINKIDIDNANLIEIN